MKSEKKSLKFKINASSNGFKRGRQVMKNFQSSINSSPFTNKEKLTMDNASTIIDPNEILSSIFKLEEKKREADLNKKKALFNKTDTQKKYYCKKNYTKFYKYRFIK